ncbi:MAG: M56 family metallopeptidase, partial [Muribaculaceae bacterium]|nr:M56 family metallopeptidase [Muribaculaceae bacterium]
MGVLFAYSFYSGVFLLSAYLLYKLVMAGEKQMRLNRAVLLGAYALSLAAWPLSLIEWRHAGLHGAVAGFHLEPLGMLAGAEPTASVWPRLLLALYVVGLAVALVATIGVMLRLLLLVRSGRHIDCGGYTLVLLPPGRVAPFSWGRYMVMGENDYEAAGAYISAHELAHIRSRHCLDLLLAQAVCVLMWYNPASWLMREELKSVHEYQADDAVISGGVDARDYQMLLIKKAVGTRFQSLANSLNHSKLKKRVTMMYKEKNSGLRRLRGLVLAMAPVVAVAVVNIPVLASAMEGMRAASLETQVRKPVQSVSKVSEIQADANAADVKNGERKAEKMPDRQAEYPGGELEMFKYLMNNIKYPEAAMKAGVEGAVVVSFN